VNLCYIDTEDIIRTIVVLDLPASLAQTFDLDCLSILDRSAKGDWSDFSDKKM